MDRELIDKHLAHIVDQVESVRRRSRPERLADDPVQLGFTVHTLQTAVQAAIDVAAMIVAERRLGEPRSNRELFEKLAADGWIPPASVPLWKHVVAFRNIVVHRYLAVDPAVARAIVEGHLDDLLAFVRAIRDRLGPA